MEISAKERRLTKEIRPLLDNLTTARLDHADNVPQGVFGNVRIVVAAQTLSRLRDPHLCRVSNRRTLGNGTWTGSSGSLSFAQKYTQ